MAVDMDETTPSGLLDRLVTVLTLAERGEGATRATSLRLPDAVHEAAMLATELGMDPSLTAATSEALLDRVRRFVRTEALAGHLAAFPSDEPELADVALRRASGTEHPAAARPDLVRAVAEVIAQRDPAWARTGRVDVTVDQVLDGVDLLVALGVEAA
jgi:hypothetical protein